MISWAKHRRAVKIHAKKSLMGKYLKGVFAALIAFSVSFLIFSFMPLQIPDTINSENPRELLMSMFPDGDLETIAAIAGIYFLLYLLLSSPLSIGTHRFYLKAIRGENPSFGTIFSSFANLREIFSSCVLTVISALWLCILSFVILVGPVVFLLYSHEFGPLAQLAALVVYCAALFLLVLLFMPVSIAPFVLADNPEKGGFKSLFTAYKMMRGAKMEFLVFNFSFILWNLLGSLSLPVSFFVTPYISASMAGFYDTIDACKKK